MWLQIDDSATTDDRYLEKLLRSARAPSTHQVARSQDKATYGSVKGIPEMYAACGKSVVQLCLTMKENCEERKKDKKQE